VGERGNGLCFGLRLDVGQTPILPSSRCAGGGMDGYRMEDDGEDTYTTQAPDLDSPGTSNTTMTASAYYD
jgi:hypothetical protein